HRIAAAVVNEVADIVGAKHLDQAAIFLRTLFDALQLVAHRAEGAARRVAQRRDRPGRLLARVDQLLAQRADDAHPAGQHLADAIAPRAGRLDDGAGRGIDDSRDAARLGI